MCLEWRLESCGNWGWVQGVYLLYEAVGNHSVIRHQQGLSWHTVGWEGHLTTAVHITRAQMLWPKSSRTRPGDKLPLPWEVLESRAIRESIGKGGSVLPRRLDKHGPCVAVEVKALWFKWKLESAEVCNSPPSLWGKRRNHKHVNIHLHLPNIFLEGCLRTR